MTDIARRPDLPTQTWKPPLLAASLKGSGAAGALSLIVLLLASLACNRLFPAGTPTPTLRDPAEPAPAYTGQFDCYGTENGTLAYAGRITVQTGGQVTFKNYDGLLQSGAWIYDEPGKTFTFSGGTDLASAIYKDGQDSLVVVLVPTAKVAHADSGMSCQRAVPGQTGPPM